MISGTIPGDGSTTTPEEPDPTPEEPATDPQPDPQPPAAPDVVTATPEGTTVLVAWGDVAGEDGFEVVRETWHRNGSWRATSLGTVAAGTLALPDSPGDGTHRYQVRAMNEVGASAWVTSPEVIIGGGGGGKPNGKGAGG